MTTNTNQTRRPLRKRRWFQATLSIVVLIIAISAAAGGGSAPKHGTTSADSPALVTNTSAPAKHAATAAAPQTFQGSGDENVGTIKVPTDSTLRWSCSACAGSYGGDNFALSNSFNDSGQIDVNALDKTSGTTVVDAGTYTDVQVLTEANNWSFTIAAGT